MEVFLGKTYDATSYASTRGAAQALADELHADVGLERVGGLGQTFRLFLLPRREYRCGHELRCEVVRPTVWSGE